MKPLLLTISIFLRLSHYLAPSHPPTSQHVSLLIPFVTIVSPTALLGSRGSIRGDIHFYGKQGMYFYTQVKTITSLWDYKPTDGMNVR